MKKIISGKVYDTSTANELGIDNGGDGFSHWSETLYQKRTGEFFLYGEGGPMTKYAVSIGQNEWSGGGRIIPLSVDKARKWAEAHLSAERYEVIFGLPGEDAGELETLHVQIPAAMMARIRQRASEEGISLKDCITDILSSAMK